MKFTVGNNLTRCTGGNHFSVSVTVGGNTFDVKMTRDELDQNVARDEARKAIVDRMRSAVKEAVDAEGATFAQIRLALENKSFYL